MTSLVGSRFEEREGGRVAFVTLDDPKHLNKMSSPLMGQLRDELGKLAADDTLRAVVITGAGDRAFVGGADITEMAGLADPHKARAFIQSVSATCHAVREIPVPVLARINGFCLGAGLELAASCDMRLACEEAMLGMPEVKLGLPSVVEAALLPMLIGWGRTRQLLYFGENIDAKTALAWGLVEGVVPRAGLDAGIDDWLRQLLSSKPRAVRLQKQLVRAWEDLPIRAAINEGVNALASAFATDEPTVSMRDFLAAQAARKANKA